MMSLHSLKSNAVIASDEVALQSSSLKTQGNSGLLRRTLSALLAMTIMLTPCQAAVEFAGNTNNYLQLDLNLNLFPELTFSTWVKSNDLSKLGIVGNDNNSFGRVVRGIGTQLQILNSQGLAGQSNHFMQLNTWTHVVVIWSGFQSKIFINGILDSHLTPEAPIYNDQTFTELGRTGPAGAAQIFSGSIDDTKYYNRILSNGEVLALFQSRSKRPSGSIANGLIAHYEMDDNNIGEVSAQVKDSSGNLRHGQFIGFDNLTTALSNDVPTQIGTGHSLTFNGATSVVDLSSVPVQSHPLTLSFWAKPDTNNPIGMFDSAPNSPNVIRNYPAGVVEWWVNDPAVNLNLTANQWVHLSFVYYYDGNRHLSYYKDGLLQQTVDGTTNSNLAWTSFRLGDINLGVHGKYQGKLDDFHIFNQALSASEISFLYNGSGIDPGTSNLQALWTFDNDSALKDSSGNNNHGVGRGGDSLKYTDGVLRR